jgi:protein-S-isoprenylcysteine O-methyltransferase Ste14
MISPGLKETLNRVRVRAGSFLAVAVLVLARPDWKSVLYGMLAAVPGLVIRAWASGHLRKEKTLAVSGPYRYSRNPLYLGNFLIGAGIAITARSWWVLALFAAYFGIFYPLMIIREKDRMKHLFPREYEDYGRQVPLFWPSLLKRHRGVPVRFSWGLYAQNKEYRALLGAAAFWLLLAAKSLVLNR